MGSMQKYLDKALDVLEDLGIDFKDREDSQLAGLLQKVVTVDEPKVLAITKTLRHMSTFNEMVRDNVADMEISDRYNDITQMFDSIREDSKKMIGQLEDGKIDLKEKAQNWWMWLWRGTPHQRFEKITDLYKDVSVDTSKNLERENKILNGYMDFRFAVKDAEILAYEVLKVQEDVHLAEAREKHSVAIKAVQDYTGDNQAEKAQLEMARDEAHRVFQEEDKKYQLLKDVAEQLTVGYNVGEALVAKLKQTHDVKEQVYNRSVTFFNTNEHVFTMLDAVYSSQHSLHEATQALEAMKTGANKGLEDVADLGRELEKAGLQAGYGATLSQESVQKLVDAVVSYQVESLELIDQYRKEATESAKAIEAHVEEGKQKCQSAIDKFYAKEE
jgi:hypothetical protein